MLDGPPHPAVDHPGGAAGPEGCDAVVHDPPEPSVAQDVAALPLRQDDPEVRHELEPVGPVLEVHVHEVPVGAGPHGLAGLERRLGHRHQGMGRVHGLRIDALGHSALAWRLRSSSVALNA